MVKKLDYNEYKGKKYSLKVKSNKYLDINVKDYGFELKFVDTNEFTNILEDDMLSEWLDNPVAYGIFVDGVLKGFVEGFLETWCNRYRISNICIFEEEDRKKGFGKILLDEILKEAKNSKARMVVLETQSYNHKAISFYQKNGFEIIGFDMYAYSNDGPKEHNMRIEMGKIL